MTRLIAFNALVLGMEVRALSLLPRKRTTWAAVLLLGLIFAAAASVAAGLAADRFQFLAMLAMALFIHGPVILAVAGVVLFPSRRPASMTAFALAVAVVATGIYSFVIEPKNLEVTRYTIRTTKLTAPLRVGVLADIQTDHVGGYERDVLRTLMAQRPDLILLPGDYIQVADPRRRQELRRALATEMRRARLAAPLGVVAVGGNVDPPGWPQVFSGTTTVVVEETRTIEAGALALTALSVEDSFDLDAIVEPAAGFHLVVGHSPDFALGRIDADLLIAGHTHGGQVRLPFVGPLLTLSSIPREWADGRTELEGGRTLIVTRGAGMERGNAPRLRFLCRPEIVVVDLVPA